MKTINFTKLCMLTLMLASLAIVSQANADPDTKRSFEELIESRGFLLKHYQLTTEDGYYLTVHRVVPRDFDPETYSRARKPVIAFHGIMSSSPVFFINSPYLQVNDSDCGDNFGFGLVLTDKYDIWLPNARANGRSSGHRTLKPSDRKYWEFSWEQIALYDIPAVIDLVRNQTGHSTVAWLGHSQGAGTLFALLSLKPEYALQIRPFIAWAPSVFTGRAKSLVSRTLALTYPLIQPLGGQFPMSGKWLASVTGVTCRPEIGTQLICAAAMEAIFGKSDSLNQTRIPVYNHFSSIYDPYSTWQMTHYGQIGKSGRFTRFDYLNPLKNMHAYGSVKPPEFPLGNIPRTNFPIVIMYGRTDALVDREDILQLVSTLRANGKQDVIEYEVPRPVWSHADFILGTGAGQLVYDKTIQYFNEFAVNDLSV